MNLPGKEVVVTFHQVKPPKNQPQLSWDSTGSPNNPFTISWSIQMLKCWTRQFLGYARARSTWFFDAFKLGSICCASWWVFYQTKWWRALLQPTTHQDFKLDLRNLKPKMSLRFPNAKAWPLLPNQSSVRESPEEAHRKVCDRNPFGRFRFFVLMIWRVISNSGIFLEHISFGFFWCYFSPFSWATRCFDIISV